MMPVSAGASKYSLQVADVLLSIGIMHSMTTGKPLRIMNEILSSLEAILLLMLVPLHHCMPLRKQTLTLDTSDVSAALC